MEFALKSYRQCYCNSRQLCLLDTEGGKYMLSPTRMTWPLFFYDLEVCHTWNSLLSVPQGPSFPCLIQKKIKEVSFKGIPFQTKCEGPGPRDIFLL